MSEDSPTILEWLTAVPAEAGVKHPLDDEEPEGETSTLDKRARLPDSDSGEDEDAQYLTGSSRAFSLWVKPKFLKPHGQCMPVNADGVQIVSIPPGSDIEQEPLLNRLSQIARGIHILPFKSHNQILIQVPEEQWAAWKFAFRSASDTRDNEPLYSWAPSTAAVKLLIERTNRALKGFGPWATQTWINAVGKLLLDWAFRKPPGVKGVFKHHLCTTALSNHQFAPFPQENGLVGFCLYADLKGEDLARLEALALCSPTSSVNHTSDRFLRLRPIVLTMEYRDPEETFETAKLMTGTYHAAHWRFLRLVLIQALHGERQSSAGSSEPVSDDMEGLAETVLDRLPYLPGMIVHGHRWMFVMSTREGNRTILWKGREIGSTEAALGIYQISAALQVITTWIHDVYLAWFRKYVLSGFE